MLLFDFHDFDSDAFFFDESDRQVFVAYGRAEDHLLAFQKRRNIRESCMTVWLEKILH